MVIETDCELVRVYLKNIKNAIDFYSDQIETILQRIEARERWQQK